MIAEAENLELVVGGSEALPDVADLRLDWLPSMPITRKRRVPPVAGIAFFFSEGDNIMYHFFETPNLRETLASYSRHQAAALGKDPDSRIGWVECEAGMSRSRLLQQLRERYHAD